MGEVLTDPKLSPELSQLLLRLHKRELKYVFRYLNSYQKSSVVVLNKTDLLFKELPSFQSVSGVSPMCVETKTVLQSVQKAPGTGNVGLENLSKTVHRGGTGLRGRGDTQSPAQTRPLSLFSLRRARRIPEKSQIHKKLEAHCFQKGLWSVTPSSVFSWGLRYSSPLPGE